ncbi:homocysteine S-methyltransferase family protein [Roseobacter sp. YSTF-M11]|uniref:Homocysteine S-methyltransferase family protein n=1 Tax=Roseobacter insulae TaxID=2859783 RepID=A0A9X1JZ94_9RHOB|nr:homocysteine S-methyltransferase family protein [Roseobacter insulae]MBW4709020.1 homocysteine S-methyltransferase family protein [Roseobacter insulae]
MTQPKYRNRLPQLGTTHLLTDGGIETTLIFHEGLDLPLFAAFTLLSSEQGQDALRRYYESYIQVAHAQSAGLILDSATWRASRVWGAQLGYDARALADANRAAVAMLFDLRSRYEGAAPFVVSGNVGPRSDGYIADELLTPSAADAYHAEQIATLATAGVDMISAITMTHAGEAAGIARACRRLGMPLALAFTVETDGRLPSGQTLGDAIREVDADPSGGPSYYMINCAHPDHFRSALQTREDWPLRIGGLRANASRKSHAELDEAETLDVGDPRALGRDYASLLPLLPNLRVFGGCCGTDHRHIHEIGHACLPARAA